MIKKRATGSPDELCKKLSISRRSWFRILAYLKNDVQAPIEYSKFRKTYFYIDNGDMTFIKWIPEKALEEAKLSTNGQANYSNK